MNNFVTIYFTVIFTLCFAAGTRLTEAGVAYIIVGMFLGIFLIIPATNLYDKYVRWIEKIHAAQHSRQEITPHSDWR